MGTSVLVCMASYSLQHVADGWGTPQDIISNLNGQIECQIVYEFVRRLLDTILASSLFNEQRTSIDGEPSVNHDFDIIITNVARTVSTVGTLLQHEINTESDGYNRYSRLYFTR